MYTFFWVPQVFLGSAVFIGVKNVSNKRCGEPETYNTVLFLVLQFSRHLTEGNCNTAPSPNLRNLNRKHILHIYFLSLLYLKFSQL
jgi:hypothetical protein